MKTLYFEGGEHIKWHLEPDGHLAGKIRSAHHTPKKRSVEWTGPVELARTDFAKPR
jgi:hypothetical protein